MPDPRARTSFCILGGALVVALVLLVPYLDVLPGLHGDEAWVGLRVREIAGGARPLYGMNVYTGPIHQYLLVPILEAFGYLVAPLRSLTVAMSLLAVVLYHLVARKLYGDRAAMLAVLVLVTLPFFTLYGRTATENFALNPCCALLAIWLLLRARDERGMRAAASALLAGVVLALGTWTHLVFLPVPLVLFLGALITLRGRVLRSRIASCALAGFALGLLPRIVQQFRSPGALEGNVPLADQLREMARWLPLRLLEWPQLFARVVHGDVLYRRYTGEVSWPTWPLLSVLLAIALVVLGARAISRCGAHCALDRGILASLPVVFLATLLLTPHNADRYLLLILYYVPLLLAILFELLWDRWLQRRRVLRVLGKIAFAGLLAFNVSRTAVNFFAAHLASGGKLAVFELGSMAETSNHFVRSDQLYDLIASRGIKNVVTERMIGWPLRFYDLEHARIARVYLAEELGGHGIDIPRATLVVAYRGGGRWLLPEQLGASRIVYQDAHFVIAAFP